ncbi:NAD(P)-dependent oxidoreductase [Kitasatospora sp. NA04385]|uniref:NAD-dependent epimerase/dehydratase family protein n=1 Tax=Kitasatospora sp. NA04385 TaxID=2742135 RepID=UPI0015924271|nr:NAD(P)-dependent oxidoreductase [Kitasatospora sp. NA04385]QKW21448.1 NAD(P)-dependent oxidoreductase [Kitasatospora sp. NA04385]
MRVLLLGADGFIGRRVADRLLAEEGLQVTVLGRGDSADIRFDLAAGSPGALARFLDAVAAQVVINCAGATYGTSRNLIRSNTLAVATVCEAIRRSREPARLVHVGSAAEYGPAQPGGPIPESAEPRPVGPYGVSKLAGTELVLNSGLDALVLRVFDVVGPGAPTASLFGRLAEGLRRALEQDEHQVRMPDLSGYRDFVDVRDVARAIQAAAVSAATGVINIGSGHAVRARDAAHLLVRASGFEGTVTEDARQVVLPAQQAGAEGLRAVEARTVAEPVQWRQADVRTARDRLGWRTQVPLEESLGDVWLETACRV